MSEHTPLAAPSREEGTPRQSNSMGLVGLIVSIIGLLTCGLLSPVGLLISFTGLFRPPRRWAAIGTVLGAVGTIWIVAAVLIFARLRPIVDEVQIITRAERYAASELNIHEFDAYVRDTGPSGATSRTVTGSADGLDADGHPARIDFRCGARFDGRGWVVSDFEVLRKPYEPDERLLKKSRLKRAWDKLNGSQSP